MPGTDSSLAALRERLAAAPWRLLASPDARGAWNMAVDRAMLRAAAAEAIPPTLRFYGWSPPAVSLGRFQPSGGVRLEYARSRGWDVVRRPTGGRAVLHQFEVTYSLVLPPSVVGGAGVRTSHAVLVEPLHRGLRSLLGGAAAPGPGPGCGARAERSANCFAVASECDTLVPGGKLVGSAQAREGGALLQHGSILLDADVGVWEALFGTPGRLVTLREILGAAPAPGTVSDAVADGFRQLGVRLVPGDLTPGEREAAPLRLAEGGVEPPP